MRIALIASGFVDYSLELAGALAEAHSVKVFADADALDRERGEAPAPAGVEVRRFSQAGLLRRWGSVTPLAAALAAWRPDAVIAHEHPHPHLSTLLRLAHRLAPLGLIVHDPQPHPGRDSIFAQRRAHEIVVQRALADRLFAHGAAGAAALARATGRPIARIVHGPILRPRTPPPPPPGAGRVLMFGRMERYKGLGVLLQAGLALRDRGARFSLDVRGDGPELERLQADLRALPSCTVRLGHIPRADLVEALAGCDLVVAPYLQASASGVVAAALANARGVVASATGGLQEAVRPGVNGLLVPPGDPDALADGLLKALAQSEQFGRGAQALAEGGFAWRPTAQAIVDTFQSGAGQDRAA